MEEKVVGLMDYKEQHMSPTTTTTTKKNNPTGIELPYSPLERGRIAFSSIERLCRAHDTQ